MREASLERNTAETKIQIKLNLDGQRQIKVATGFGLLDHMLTLIAFWADFDLELNCIGDHHIDAHHSAEDTGLILGQAILIALGDKAGIARVGHGRVPMDEALAEATIDLSGRPWLEWRGDDLLPAIMAGEERDIWREFYKAVATAAKINLHISFHYGKNGHHLLESAAKGLGLALAAAIKINGSKLRSSKGSID